MTVSATDFHPMRGHICEGCVVVMSDGRRFTLHHTMQGNEYGWVLRGESDSDLPSALLRTAYEVCRWIAETEVGELQ